MASLVPNNRGPRRSLIWRAWRRNTLAKFRQLIYTWKNKPHFWDKTPEEKILVKILPKRIPSWKEIQVLFSVLNRQEIIVFRLCVLAFSLIILSAGALALKPWLYYRPVAGGELREIIPGADNLSFINPLLPSGRPGEDQLLTTLFLPIVNQAEEVKILDRNQNDKSQTEKTPAQMALDQIKKLPENNQSLGRVVRDIEGKTFYVLLRSGLNWSDGEPVTAMDVDTSLDLIVNPKTRSPLRGSYTGVTTALWPDTDNLGIIFTLRNPNPDFASVLAQFRPAPIHIFKQIKPELLAQAKFNQKPVGNNHWVFESLVREADETVSQIKLKSRDLPGSVNIYLDYYSYLVAQSVSDAVATIEDGKADFFLTPSKNLSSVSIDNLARQSLPEISTLALTVNRATDSLKDRSDRASLLLSLWSLRGLAAERLDESGNPTYPRYTDAAGNLASEIWQASDQILKPLEAKQVSWKFTTAVKTTTLWDLIVPASESPTGEWETVVGEANLALQKKYGGTKAPQINLSVLPLAEWQRRYSVGDYDLALVRQNISTIGDLRSWWWGTGDNDLLYRDPLRNQILDRYVQKQDISLETLLAGLLPEWPGIIWDTDTWSIVSQKALNSSQNLSLSNHAQWKDLLWVNGHWSIKWPNQNN